MDGARFIVLPALVVILTFVITQAVAAGVVWQYELTGSDPWGRWRAKHPDVADYLPTLAWMLVVALFVGFFVASGPVWSVMVCLFAAGFAALTAHRRHGRGS